MVFIDAICDAAAAAALRAAGAAHVVHYSGAGATGLAAAHYAASFFAGLRCGGSVPEAHIFAVQAVSAHMTGACPVTMRCCGRRACALAPAALLRNGATCLPMRQRNGRAQQAP